MNTQQLTDDLKVIAHDAEDLIKATAGEVSEKAREARSRLMTALESAKKTCGQLQEKAITSAKATDQVIRAHPYESIGVSFGVGLLIGVLLGRGKS
jgi:ElaB/YqjD/DUF883 family membrane-anchored ribosome-binding protein